MPLKVLIVPDKFKGTLTALAAAELMAKGWKDSRGADQVELLPMSDGGDGFGEVLGRLRNAEMKTVDTLDAARRPIRAAWWWDSKTTTAIIESARVIGLALLPPNKFHPFDLDTFGLGAVMDAASSIGARHCLMGIGGSATNDGGFGVASARGWTFLDNRGQPIEQWRRLDLLHRISPPTSRGELPELLVAVDVQNPLLGAKGASRIYGPQKGLRSEDIEHAENCLCRLAEVVGRDLGSNAAIEPGAGAAGGLGFGMRCFFGARLESGFDIFARCARLRERIRAAQLVITGEGAIDASTLMGKGVGEVARLCNEAGIPCIGLAGTLHDSVATDQSKGQRFLHALGMSPHLTTSDLAMRDPQVWLPRLAAEVARRWAENQ